MQRQPGSPITPPLASFSQTFYDGLTHQEQAFRAEIAEKNDKNAISGGAVQTTSSNTDEPPFRITADAENLHGTRLINDTNRTDEIATAQPAHCVGWGVSNVGAWGYVQRQPEGVVESVHSSTIPGSGDMCFSHTLSAASAIQKGRLLIAQAEAWIAQYGDAGDAA